MRRRLVIVVIFVLAGAVVNVAVAWELGLAMRCPAAIVGLLLEGAPICSRDSLS